MRIRNAEYRAARSVCAVTIASRTHCASSFPVAPSRGGTLLASDQRMSQQNLALTLAPEVTGEPERWRESSDTRGNPSELDLKTKALCYLSALAAARLPNEVPFRAARARALGATRDELLGAILVGLRAVGRSDVDEPLPTFGGIGG